MATEVGKAYVQIVPSAKGISSSISSELNGSGAAQTAGSSFGGNLAMAIKGAIAVAAIGKFIGDAVTEGAQLEQSLGGVETLFKDSADKVKENAKKAYMSAGVDANTYMETVTSYAASLVTSCAGDTSKAADVADLAMTDMSDNANKMGTSMESIQNAYNGFAKQNYTMLDNLKLGYGGTKTEMERLLADAQEISGVEYDISNLSDVYQAIHVIQTELGITGTTADEAATTVSGSLTMLKSAWTDLLGNLALGQNVSTSLQNVITSAGQFMANLIPMVVNVLMSVPQALIGALPTLLPTLQQTGQTILQNITGGVEMSFPELLQKGVDMIVGFAETVLANLPTIISMAGDLISTIIRVIMQNLPTIWQKGVELVGRIARGFLDNLPEIVGAIAKMFVKIVSTIGSNLPTMLQKGIELIGHIISGILRAIPDIIAAMPEVISSVVDAFQSVDWGEIGSNIISGIVKGLSNAVGEIVEAAKEAAASALEAAKEALGIASPSKVFAKEVGKFIPAGIAIGIDDNTDSVTSAMTALSKSAVSATDMSGTVIATGGNDRIEQVLGLLETYLPSCAEPTILTDESFTNGLNKQLGFGVV